MRLNETQRRSGHFWLPSDPDKRFSGTLRIEDGGEIELEVLGVFGQESDFLNDIPSIPRIVGFVEDGGPVTLDDCLCLSSSLGLGNAISKSRFLVHRALLGAHYDDDEPVVLHDFRLSVEGLDDWLRLPGISVDSDLENSAVSIYYRKPEAIALDVSESFRISFEPTWTLSPGFAEARITQKAHAKIKADQPRELDEYIAVVRRLVNFMCFAIDETVTLDHASATVLARTEQSDELQPVRIKLFYPSRPFTERRPKAQRHRMLFTYARIEGAAEARLRNWLSAYERFQPAFDLYFAAKSGDHKNVNARFLAYIQGIETFHRRSSDETRMEEADYQELVSQLLESCPEQHRELLSGLLRYGNVIGLSARLRRVIEPFTKQFGSSETREKLIRKLVDTRNYLTHYEEALADTAATDGSELASLCASAEAILQLHFLCEIGFDDATVSELCANSVSLRAKIQGIPA